MNNDSQKKDPEPPPAALPRRYSPGMRCHRGGSGGSASAPCHVLAHSSSNKSISSLVSEQSSYGSNVVDTVDIGRDHGRQLFRGRESHTSDLEEFDRYVARLRMIERGVTGGRGPLHGTVSMPCSGADDNDNRNSSGDDESCDGDKEGENRNGDGNREVESMSSQAGICEEFWQFVRNILARATPVGFDELPDPESVVPKGKVDADAFLTKAVSLGLINPIHPALIARESGIPHETVMEELLYATKVGLVSMRWAPECERCGSAVTDANRIGDLPGRADCDGCHYPNPIDSMDRIKVLFHLTQDVFYVLANNYACTPSSASMAENALFAAIPATSTGSGFRYSVGCGSDELRPALDPGRYRMHCPVAKTDNFLNVQKEAGEGDAPVKLKLRVSKIVCDGGPSAERAELTVPHGRIHFDVLPDTHSFFVLWIQNNRDDDSLMRLPAEERAPYTSATEMIHHSAFQQLFADQVVSSRPEALLKIQNVVLVFTDVVGSTNLYASLGDGPALQLVRQHYQVLFAAFTRRGRVVKTVGDAVMASFSSGRHAIEGCAEALRRVPKACILPDGTSLQIRIGIHCGSAVVVPLNGVNDYFGQTVNIAARVEAAAKASECFITEAVLSSDPEARSAYLEVLAGKNEASCRKPGTFEATPETELNLKGVEEPVRARGMRLRRRQRRPSDMSGMYPARQYRRSALFGRIELGIEGEEGLESDFVAPGSISFDGSATENGSLPGPLSRRGSCPSRHSSIGSINEEESEEREQLKNNSRAGVMGVSTRPATMGRRRSSLILAVDELAEDSEDDI